MPEILFLLAIWSTLKPDNLGSNSIPAIWLCDLGQEAASVRPGFLLRTKIVCLPPRLLWASRKRLDGVRLPKL